MTFSTEQVKALEGKLNAKHVRTRESAGRTLAYIEGWHAIAEANRIFGFDSWDRQTVSSKCVWQGPYGGKEACSYVARVRIGVRVGDITICRERSGSGHGIGNTPGEAHESALKEAETDAMKRALATFGNPFGLALYDKERRGVRGTIITSKGNGEAEKPILILLSPEGQQLGTHKDPGPYCSAVKQVLESLSKVDRLARFWDHNAAVIEGLRTAFPGLKSDKGTHFADILRTLYRQRHKALSDRSKPAKSKRKPSCATPPIDKTELPIGEPRRLRDKDHLRHVAALPCLICGRTPSQSHHLRFTQPRAMGRKVSDEWVVPLCATHHRAIHDTSSEEEWWKSAGIEPIHEAEELWKRSKQNEAHLTQEAVS